MEGIEGVRRTAEEAPKCKPAEEGSSLHLPRPSGLPCGGGAESAKEIPPCGAATVGRNRAGHKTGTFTRFRRCTGYRKARKGEKACPECAHSRFDFGKEVYCRLKDSYAIPKRTCPRNCVCDRWCAEETPEEKRFLKEGMEVF